VQKQKSLEIRDFKAFVFLAAEAGGELSELKGFARINCGVQYRDSAPKKFRKFFVFKAKNC
jgi:hypothetical protein